MSNKYVAYVGSYSYTGTAKGITIYDINLDKGNFIKRGEVDVDNSSYLTLSNDNKILYSIADEGIVSFRIHENGTIRRIGCASIRGMRGCHLSIDKDNKYIFVSGYHDGKLTMLHLNEDGTVGEIAENIYNKGLGSIAERNSRPHVSCTRTSPDEQFVLSADLGIDQVKIYNFDKQNGNLLLVDTLRLELNSAPRFFEFSKDGRFMYLMYEMKNCIDVFSYSYKEGDKAPTLEKIQSISSLGNLKASPVTAATTITFTPDFKYLLCANAGDNVVATFERDEESGLLSSLFTLPISGDYPKDIAILPDAKHIASINHENGSISFFNIDFKNKLISMSANNINVNQPNCCKIVEV